ncbi:MAG: hypothetical protein AAGE52_23165 [Myxococcota bacterium]
MRWSLALLALPLLQCGDSTPARECDLATDCAADEQCVRGFCIAIPQDAGGRADAARDAARDAGDIGVDAARDAGTDVAVDTGTDAGGPACGPGDVASQPLVLYEFDDGDSPTMVRDQAPAAPNVPLTGDGSGVLVEGGRVTFVTGRLTASLAASDQLVEALAGSGSMTVEAWIRPVDFVIEDSIGPERIITLSRSSADRLFTVGQDEMDFVGRLRTNRTDFNGTRCLDAGPMPEFDAGVPVRPRSTLFVSGIDDLMEVYQLVLVFDEAEGRPRAYLNGSPMADRFPCIEGRLNWMTGEHQLGMGNEIDFPTSDRQFEGQVLRTTIYDRPWDTAEVNCWFAAGPDAPVLP